MITIKVKNYLLPVIIGFLVGIFTLTGQKYLPVNLNFLANSASMWLIPSFLIPYYLKTNKKHSIIISILTLIFCIAGYYIFEALMNNHSLSIDGYIILWLGCALAGGFVFGLGANFSNTKENILKYIGMNLLPAVFIAEGLDKVIHFNEYSHMRIGILLTILIGIVLYFLINNKASFKRKNLLSIICLVILGVAGFGLLFGA